MIGAFAGLRISFSANALAETTERTFPESRHRSKRIHKKLCQRHGGEFKKEPCIWRTPHGIVAHPAFKSEIERAALFPERRNEHD